MCATSGRQYFFGREEAAPKDLPDAGTRDLQAIPGIMGTRVLRGGGAAAGAVENLAEEDGRDAEFPRAIEIEHPLAGKHVVEVTDGCVIAPDEGVGATVIPHDEGVKNGLPRSGEQVVCAQRSHHHPLRRVVDVDERLHGHDPVMGLDVLGPLHLYLRHDE